MNEAETALWQETESLKDKVRELNDEVKRLKALAEIGALVQRKARIFDLMVLKWRAAEEYAKPFPPGEDGQREYQAYIQTGDDFDRAFKAYLNEVK